MNKLFFLTPKSDVAYIHEGDSLRQALEKMQHRGYSAIPLLSDEGKYIGTLTEGDLLWALKEKNFPGITEMEKYTILDVDRKRDNSPVHIQADMEDLLEKVMNQNFVPVVDDKAVFIGIVTRKEVIQYLKAK